MSGKNAIPGYPVQNLQTMLITIDTARNERTRLTASGIYDQETANEIGKLQKRHGMPVTGVTDEATWDTVCSDYEEAKIEVEHAEILQVPLKCGEVVKRGENHPAVLIAQAILKLMAETCENFVAPEISGTLDMITAEGLEAVQMMAEYPVTGELDKKTWKLLANNFPIVAERKLNTDSLPPSDCYRL